MKYLLLCLLIVPRVLTAQDDAVALHKQIAQQFSTATTLKIEAVAASTPAMKVSITARRGNKFILDMPDRTITCNGKDVWNYTKEKKSVVISKFNPASNGLSVEKVLLDIIARYKPMSLKNQSSVKSASYLLTLQPNGETLYGVKSIALTLDGKKKNIQRISMSGDQGNQEWIVKSLQTNANVKDAVFNYSAPKGVEVIDMRE